MQPGVQKTGKQWVRYIIFLLFTCCITVCSLAVAMSFPKSHRSYHATNTHGYRILQFLGTEFPLFSSQTWAWPWPSATINLFRHLFDSFQTLIKVNFYICLLLMLLMCLVSCWDADGWGHFHIFYLSFFLYFITCMQVYTYFHLHTYLKQVNYF